MSNEATNSLTDEQVIEEFQWRKSLAQKSLVVLTVVVALFGLLVLFSDSIRPLVDRLGGWVPAILWLILGSCYLIATALIRGNYKCPRCNDPVTGEDFYPLIPIAGINPGRIWRPPKECEKCGAQFEKMEHCSAK